jgi:hypothetical protein
MRGTKNSVIHIDRSEKSVIKIDRDSRSTWMSEFSVPHMFRTRVTLGFLKSVFCNEPWRIFHLFLDLRCVILQMTLPSASGCHCAGIYHILWRGPLVSALRNQFFHDIVLVGGKVLNQFFHDTIGWRQSSEPVFSWYYRLAAKCRTSVFMILYVGGKVLNQFFHDTIGWRQGEEPVFLKMKL